MKKRNVQIVFEAMPTDRDIDVTELAELTGLRKRQAASSAEGLNRRGFVSRVSKGTYRRDPSAVFTVKELRQVRRTAGFAASMEDTIREVTVEGKPWSAHCVGPECAAVTRKPHAKLCGPCNSVAFSSGESYIPAPPFRPGQA